MRNSNGKFGLHCTAHSKLSPAQVQHVRDLHRCGFSASTLAVAFNITYRAVWNITTGRSWYHLPDVAGPLPTLSLPHARGLKLHKPSTITPTQRQQLDSYRKQLSQQWDLEAEREGLALALLQDWTRRPRLKGTS